MNSTTTLQDIGRALRFFRALLFFPYVVVITVVLALPVILPAVLGFQRVASAVVRLWCQLVRVYFGISLKILGREHLNKSGTRGVLYVFNHQSHLDIPIMVGATPGNVRFGAKVELFKVPIFGPVIKSVGTLPIARGKLEEVIRVYKAAEPNFDKGFSYVLAPEGTRQENPAIGQFKKGPFIFAINARTSLAPVVITGAHAVLPKNSLLPGLNSWTHPVIVEFLPQVSSAGYTMESLDAYVTAVRDQMVTAYERGSFALRALKAQQG